MRLSAHQREVIRALVVGGELRPEGRQYRMYQDGYRPLFRVDCKTQRMLVDNGLIERKDDEHYGLARAGWAEAVRRGWAESVPEETVRAPLDWLGEKLEESESWPNESG